MASEVYRLTASTPTDDPAGETPVHDAPEDPPYLALQGVADGVMQAQQQIVDSLYADLSDAVSAVQDAEISLRAPILDSLARVEVGVTDAANVVAGHVMGQLAHVAGDVAGVPGFDLDPVAVGESARRLPLPGGGLPPFPSLPFPTGQLPSARVGLVTHPNVPFGVADVTRRPDWVVALTDQYAPAIVTSVGIPPTPENLGNSREDSPSGSVYTGSAPQSLTGRDAGLAELGRDSATVFGDAGADVDLWGGVYGPRPVPFRPLPFGREIPQTATNAETSDPSAGSAVNDRAPGDAAPTTACPPVHVHVHCAPGTTAKEGEAPDLTTVSAEVTEALVLGEGGGFQRDAPMEFPVDGKPVRDTARETTDDDKRAERMSIALRAMGLALGQGVRDRLARILNEAGTIRACRDIEKLNAEIGDVKGWFYEWLIGSKDGKTITKDSVVGRVITGFTRQDQVWMGWVATIAANTLTSIVGAIELAVTLAGCAEPLYVVCAGLRSLIGVVEKWTGAPFPEGRTRLDQIIGVVCAVRIPTTTEAHAAYLADLIDSETWKCWVRSNGDRDDVAEIARDALRTIPSPLQITSVWQRLTSRPDELNRMLREAGVIEKRHVEYFRELAKYLPAPGDLVSFMVRDVFDERIVAKYGYDDDLESKFQGQAKDWARGQGMTIDQFRYYWRAHWRLPSPTQGYEMVHRLRPGRVAPELVTTRETVQELLQVNDYPTFWRDRLVEISYRPLTRVDTRRAYFIGALTEDETKEAILDLGYDEGNAELLLRYWRVERVNWAANQPWARAYARGELSDAELRERVARMKLTGLQQDELEQELDLRAEMTRRKGVVKAIRQRVVSGLTGWEQARDELVRLGYRQSRAASIAQGWEEERAAKGRAPSAAELCKMFDAGFIDGTEYSASLMRLGYSLKDVRNIIGLCEVKQKREPSGFGTVPDEPAAQAAAQEQAARTRERRAKNAEFARAVRSRRRLNAAEEKVVKKLVATTNVLAKHLGGTAGDYSAGVNRLHSLLIDELCYTRQGAADLVAEVVSGLARAGRSDWEEMAAAYVGQLPPRPCPPADADGTPPADELAERETP